MKKKGFTLIELLAIIAILAIIALIAVPVVLNIINKARVSSYARSSENILESARLLYSESKIDRDMDLSGDKYNEIINTISGDAPDSGQIYIKRGGKIAMLLKYGEHCYIKSYDDSTITHSEGDVCSSNEKEFTNDRILELVTEQYNDTKEIEGLYDAIKDQVGGEKPTIAEVKVNAEEKLAIALGYTDACYVKNYDEDSFSTKELEAGKTCSIEDGISLVFGDVELEVVTSGDGLYQDSDGIYRYKGSNPNNYIMLGEEEYRIIAVEEQGIKVVRSSSTMTMGWDIGNMPVDMCSETSGNCERYDANNTYCSSATVVADIYYGCNIWSNASEIKQNGVISNTITNGEFSGTVTENSMVYNYLHAGYYYSLQSVSSHIVEDATWNIGAVSNNATLGTLKTEESSWTWNGKIGLPTVSDFIMAQLPSDLYTNDTPAVGYGTFTKNNWMSFGLGTNGYESYWTMNLSGSNVRSLSFVSEQPDNSYIYMDPAGAEYHVFPVVYLSSDIELSGNGTQGSGAYQIVES